MQVFKTGRLKKGGSLFLKNAANIFINHCFITVGKYTEWADETKPPEVTDHTSTDEIIIYKKPRLVMLATKTSCGGISCGVQNIDGEAYYLIDPNNPDLINSNAEYIYIEGDIRFSDYLCAYFRTTSIVINAIAPNNKILFKPEQMIDLGYPYISINHTRITREDNQRHLVRQLIKL